MIDISISKNDAPETTNASDIQTKPLDSKLLCPKA
jgi:hypothetical protein